MDPPTAKCLRCAAPEDQSRDHDEKARREAELGRGGSDERVRDHGEDQGDDIGAEACDGMPRTPFDCDPVSVHEADSTRTSDRLVWMIWS